MRNLIIVILCFLSFKILAQNYEADEIYVKFKSSQTTVQANNNTDVVNLAVFKSALKLNDVQKEKIEQVNAPFYFSKSAEIQQTLRLKISSDAELNTLINDLNNDPNVEYAERIPVMEKSFVPNDLGLNSTTGQWALHKIQAPNAWDISTGNSSIVVAVVDDAIQTDHIDLNGKCLQGRDVADGDNDPRPRSTCHSHGTHVAGIAGASTNNSSGIASIGYDVSILPVKATYDSDITCRAINRAYEGVVWAADNGADIINMSWGGDGYSITNQNIINYASGLGIILVAAAGNDNISNAYYPAAYDNVVSVAATNINDSKASFSNYGNWVDISAPGASINSTVPFNSYVLYDGTSMASPMVAGLCGLVWSADIGQSAQSVINCIINTADNIDVQNSGFIGQLGTGRINAYQALLCASPIICETNKTFTTPISNFIDQEVSNWIEGKTNNIIQPGANVTYDAGNQVRLKPGFKALNGSRFHAFIDGCGGNAKLTSTTNGDLELDDFELNVYPNPVNQLANITYQLLEEDKISIYIFDATGKQLQTLTENQLQISGQHQLKFDASNLPTGIYYLKLQSNENNSIKKLMITK